MSAFFPSGANTVNRRNHLTDNQIEQYLKDSYGPGMDDENFKSHIKDCKHCRLRLERQELGVLKTGSENEIRSPDCPAEEILRAFAVGICPPETSREILLHVTDCNYCAPLLKVYLATVEGPELPGFFSRLVSRFVFLLQVPALPKSYFAGGTALILFTTLAAVPLVRKYKLQKAANRVAAAVR